MALIGTHTFGEGALRPARAALAGDTGIGDSLPRSRPTFAAWLELSMLGSIFVFSVIGAMILNSFLNIGFLGILIAAGIGAVGVIALISSTSLILQSGDADSAIPGALALFAGVFNIFVATLNILLRLFGGDRRR